MLQGCKESGGTWCILDTEGIQKQDFNQKVSLWIDENNGFLFGEELDVYRDEQDQLKHKAKAIIYSTDDGLHWLKNTYGEGVFVSVFKSNAGTFAIKAKLTTQNRGSVVYKLGKDHNWDIWMEDNRLIRDLYFISNQIGFITFKQDDGHFQWQKTQDGGKNWLPMHTMLPIGPEVAISDQCIWYMCMGEANQLQKDVVVQVNIADGTTSNVSFPKYVKSVRLDQFQGKLYAVGHHKNELLFLEKSNSEQFKTISKVNVGNHLPSYFKIMGKHIFVVLTSATAIQVESFGLRSLDGGKSWTKESFKSPNFTGPVASYELPDQDQFVTVMDAGNGKLQASCLY